MQVGVRCRFNPWVGKIPWRRAQPTPVLLPGKSPCTEEPGRLQSIVLHRVGHGWSDWARSTCNQNNINTLNKTVSNSSVSTDFLISLFKIKPLFPRQESKFMYLCNLTTITFPVTEQLPTCLPCQIYSYIWNSSLWKYQTTSWTSNKKKAMLSWVGES